MSGWIAATVAGVVAGIAGALGLGGGSVLLLYLTMFAGVPQRQAQGINLIFFIPCAVVALFMHSRSKLVRWRDALPSAAVGLVGSFGGYAVSGILDESLLRSIFAIFLLVLGVREFFRPPSKGIRQTAPGGFANASGAAESTAGQPQERE